MSVLLQISDPHFGTERPPVVEALARLSAELSADVVVLSGDITQRARKRQFAAAAAFVRRLAIPRTLAIPGNHDIPLFNLVARFVDPYREYRRAFGDDLEPTFSADDCLVLCVNSTRRYRHTDGEISDEQRERVSGRLRGASPVQLRVVVTHQPVAVPREGELHNVAHGSRRAVRAWCEAGADLILAGHIHLPFVLPLHEVAGTLPRPLWAVNAGTAISRRTRRDAGNSVNVLRTSRSEPRVCTVEQWTFNRMRAAFERTRVVRIGTSPSP